MGKWAEVDLLQNDSNSRKTIRPSAKRLVFPQNVSSLRKTARISEGHLEFRRDGANWEGRSKSPRDGANFGGTTQISEGRREFPQNGVTSRTIARSPQRRCDKTRVGAPVHREAIPPSSAPRS